MEIVTAGVANRCDESFRALTTNERSRLRRQTLRVRGTAAMWW